MPKYLAAVRNLRCERPLIIDGKSVGSRVASMIIDELRSGPVDAQR